MKIIGTTRVGLIVDWVHANEHGTEIGVTRERLRGDWLHVNNEGKAIGTTRRPIIGLRFVHEDMQGKLLGFSRAANLSDFAHENPNREVIARTNGTIFRYFEHFCWGSDHSFEFHRMFFP